MRVGGWVGVCVCVCVCVCVSGQYRYKSINIQSASLNSPDAELWKCKALIWIARQTLLKCCVLWVIILIN
jgi:hypothetical protein